MSVSSGYLKKIGYLILVFVIILFWACGGSGSSNGIGDISDTGLDVSDILDCGKTDPRHLWSKRFGGSYVDYGNSVSVDSLGNVYGTGFFYGSNVDFGGCPLSSAGDSDIYLIKYAP
jgi:hypothetical protein